MIRVGTVVRLKPSLRRKARRKSETAKVIAKLTRVAGWSDGVRLDGTLDGFHYWPIGDLERAPAGQRR